MRSEQVFRASEQVGNRFLLCRLTSRTTRCLHFASANTQDAIVDAFCRLSLLPPADQPGTPRMNASSYPLQTGFIARK